MAFDDKSIPGRHPEATSRTVNGEEVIMLPHAGYVHVLNKVGTFLWEHMDGRRTVEDLARAMADDFEMDYDTVRSDVLELLNELEEKNAVTSQS